MICNLTDDALHIGKVWGSELHVVNNELYCLKMMSLKQGFECSIHHHKNKTETFLITDGEMELFIEGVKYRLRRGDYVTIKPNEKHQFFGISDVSFIEVSTFDSPHDSYRETESRRRNAKS